MTDRTGQIECPQHKCHMSDCFDLHYPNASRSGDDQPEGLTTEQLREVIGLLHEDMQNE